MSLSPKASTGARKLAQYCAFGRGTQAEQAARPQRGIWHYYNLRNLIARVDPQLALLGRIDRDLQRDRMLSRERLSIVMPTPR